MRRDTVRIKSHVQVEEKVEKSDLKATDKILQRTTVAHERTKHINMSNIHHFVREGPQRGANNLKYVRFDGMVADTLSHSGKKVSIESVVIYHRVILTVCFNVYRCKEVN